MEAMRAVLETGEMVLVEMGGQAPMEGADRVKKELNWQDYKEKYDAMIEMVPFDEHWARDLILVGHNAIRAELMDLQRVVLSFFKRHFQVAKAEVEQLFQWWDVLVDLIGEYFDYEEVLFFPWISERTQLKPEKYGIHMRLHMKAKLLVVMRKIDSYQQTLMYAATGEKLPELCALFRFFSEALGEYLRYEEKKLRGTIASMYTEYEANEYYKRMEQFIRGADNPYELYLFFTRHIKGKKEWFPRIAAELRGDAPAHAKARGHFYLLKERPTSVPQPRPSTVHDDTADWNRPSVQIEKHVQVATPEAQAGQSPSPRTPVKNSPRRFASTPLPEREASQRGSELLKPQTQRDVTASPKPPPKSPKRAFGLRRPLRGNKA